MSISRRSFLGGILASLGVAPMAAKAEVQLEKHLPAIFKLTDCHSGMNSIVNPQDTMEFIQRAGFEWDVKGLERSFFKHDAAWYHRNVVYGKRAPRGLYGEEHCRELANNDDFVTIASKKSFFEHRVKS